MTDTTTQPTAADMAAVIRECCRQVRPDLTGPQQGPVFTVTSAVNGRRYVVTVTEEGQS
jgi:hypothetical protein